MKRLMMSAALLSLTLTACGTGSQVPENSKDGSQTAVFSASTTPDLATAEAILSGEQTSWTFSNGETVEWTVTPDGGVIPQGESRSYGDVAALLQSIESYEAGLGMKAQGIGYGNEYNVTVATTTEMVCTTTFWGCVDHRYRVTTATTYNLTQQKLWPNRIIYYRLSSNLDTASINAFYAAVGEWNTKVPTITWQQAPASWDVASVVVSSKDMPLNEQGYATTGFQKGQANILNFNRARADKGNITHLMGHVAGLGNEWRHPKASSYMTLHPALKTVSEFGPIGGTDLSSFWEEGNTSYVYFKLEDERVTEFDYNSVMNLPHWAYNNLTGGAAPFTPIYGVNGYVGDPAKLGKAQGLSEGDINTLVQLYHIGWVNNTTVTYK